MSYRILSSNVILGGGSIPEYALVAAPDGALQIERLDGNAAVLDVDGNLECEHLTLTSLTPENRVITTDPLGRLIVTGFDADGLGNASALTSGTLPGDRLQGGSYTFANLTTTGGVTVGSLVANIDAANIVSGILPAGRLVGNYGFGNLLLANTLTAKTLSANISADNLTSGTLSDDRLSGPYAFGSLTLSGNLNAAWVNANLSANNLVTGVLDPARLQGSYTFSNLTVTNNLVANAVQIPTLPGSNVLLSNANGFIISSNVTETELGYVSGVVSPIQTQINELGNGNIVGSNITNLDANNITFGTLPDGRLSGAYGFESLTLTGSLLANSVSGDLNASQLVSGVVPSQRLAGSYGVTNLTASGTVTAATVSGNLNASQLVSGTVPAARLAGGSYTFTSLDLTGNLDAGTINANVDAASLVAGTVDNARLDLEGLVSNVTPALTNLTLGTPSNAWSHVHATTVHVDDIQLGNAIMYNGNAVVVDLEQTTRNIVAAGPQYSIGTAATPWSNVYAANVLVGNVILSGSLLNDQLDPYLDLSNIETNVNPATAGLTVGTVDRPWTNVVSTSATVQTFAVSGNVTSNLVPATSGLDLGSTTQRWGNVYADHLYANVDAADIYGELDANIVFTGGSIDDFVIKAPAGTAAQPGLRFTDDDQTGLFLPAPGTMGLSCGNATALTIDASTMTVSGNVVPGADASYDLGNATAAWRDVHIANALHAGPVTIAGGSVTGVTDLDVSGNLDAGNVVATGTVSGSTLVGNLDAASLTGIIDPARISGDYVVANLTVTGDATIGGTTTVQPSGHILPQANMQYDLGSSTNVWRDIYLAGSTIYLGNATIHEETGNVVISKLNITGSIIADGLLADMSISNVQICDTNWTILDDTALPPEGGKFLLNGSGFGPGCLCQVGGVNAASTSYVSPAQLRVEVGARATGTYPLTVIRGDTQTATLPSGLTYSNAVTWITSSTLGNVYEGQTFTIQLEATSDSTVTYANVTSLPADTTLDPVTGNLTGNITSITQSTLFAFDVDATDQELQDARRSFLLQLIIILINGATYTDASWNALTQTALDANSGSVYFTVDGDAMSTVTGVLVGGTPATSFVAVDNSTLRVTGPQKPRGTYDVTLQNSIGSKVLQNGVFYSDVPEWLTSANLGVVETGQSFTISLQATSDSAISSYSNVTNIPTEVTFDGISGNLAGNIVSSNTSTVHTFDIAAYDQELQRSLRTFTLQYTYIPGTIAEIKQLYGTTSGVYKIRIGGESKNVFFDLDGTYTGGDTRGFMLYQSFGSQNLQNASAGSRIVAASPGIGVQDPTPMVNAGWSFSPVGHMWDPWNYNPDPADTNALYHVHVRADGGNYTYNGDTYINQLVGLPTDVTRMAVKVGSFYPGDGGVEMRVNGSMAYDFAAGEAARVVLANYSPSGATPHLNLYQNAEMIYLYYIFVGGQILYNSPPMIWSGSGSTAFVYSDNSAKDGKKIAWGDNLYGQLGIGNNLSPQSFRDITNNGTLLGRVIKQAAYGFRHALFLCHDNTVHSCGDNSTAGFEGALGDGTSTNRLIPVNITNSGSLSGRTVVKIAACGNWGSFAVCSDGTLHGWGFNGVNGTGLGTNSLSPVLISNNGSIGGRFVTNVFSGWSSTQAICSDGTIHSWGSNHRGQVGDGTTTDRTVPVNISSSGDLPGKTITHIGTGGYVSGAVCTDGSFIVWGDRSYGVLGDGFSEVNTYNARPTDVRLGSMTGKSVAYANFGSNNGIAICTDNTLHAWGYGGGMVGDGTYTQRDTPVNITTSGSLSGKTLSTAKFLTVARVAAFIQCTDGSIHGWGYPFGNATVYNAPIDITNSF